MKNNPFFLKLFPMLGKILSHIFMELYVRKFAWSLLLKIVLPLPLPPHPTCHNGNSSVCVSVEQGN